MKIINKVLKGIDKIQTFFRVIHALNVGLQAFRDDLAKNDLNHIIESEGENV